MGITDDAGHRYTEAQIREIERRIAAEYAQAEREVQAKLDDYLRRFAIKDELKRKALAAGKITQAEYDQWRIGQLMMGQRWAEMRDTLAGDFTKADAMAKSIAFDGMTNVYAENFNYGTYEIEKLTGIDTSFTLYDKNAVEELLKNEDTFIPAPGRKVTRAINEGKALAWNKKQVQSVMLQGILQGESIPKLASRLAKAVGDSDRKAAIRNARTMMTGVQNAGRVASYDRANKMGIETQKQWLASLDNRTRHWHAELDGTKVDNDEPFENEYGEIMYPGDPNADPANIFNCRCTLIASIKGFERDVSDIGKRNDKLGGMSYSEWKAGHYKQQSEPITRQDDIAETMRAVYGAEYRAYRNLTGADDDGTISSQNSRMGLNLQLFAEEDIKNQSSTSLKKAIRKYEKRIQEHEQKIANPEAAVDDWNADSEQQKKGTIKHWQKEIRNFQENINDRIEELKKRGDWDEQG